MAGLPTILIWVLNAASIVCRTLSPQADELLKQT